MPENENTSGITAGAIALDLSVNDKIDLQIGQIAKTAAVSAAKIGTAIEKAISAPFEKSSRHISETIKNILAETESAVGSTEMRLPDIEVPAVRMPDIEQPVIEPAVRTPDIKLPEVNAPEINFPDIETPEIEPEVKFSDIEMPEIEPETVTVQVDADISQAVDAISEVEDRIRDISTTVSVGVDIRNTVTNEPYQEDNDIDRIIAEAVERWKGQTQTALETVTSEPRTPSFYDWKKEKAEFDKRAAEVDAICDKLYNKTAETTEKVNEKFAEIGRFEVGSEPVERLMQEIELTGSKLDLLQKKWQELAAVDDPTDKVISQLTATENQIISTQKKLDKLRESLSKMEAPEAVEVPQPKVDIPQVKAQKAPDISSALNGGASGIAGMIGTAVSGNPAVGAAVSSITKNVTGAVSGAFSKLSRLIDKVTSGASARLKRLAVNFIDITKPIKRLGKVLTGAFKSVFLAAGIYAAFRALKDGLLEAANADERFSKSLNEVKANLAIAFTPIILHIMPMLDSLMEKLAVVTKQIAGFTANLFGMTYKQAADATKKIKDVTAAAKKAKLAVAGIDELNILSDNSTDDQQGIDFSKLDMSEPELPDWAERLKESIRKGDWYGAGTALADKVNEVLNSVDWDAAENNVRNKVKKLADLINGFTDRLDPKAIGNAIAGVLNTITGAVNTFADNVKWENIGRKLAQGLNTAVRKIKWGELGRALTAGIRILTDLLYGFSSNFDFAALGKGLSESVNAAVESIDTVKMAKTLSNLIKGAITTATEFLKGTDFNKIGEKIGDFLENLDYENIIRGGAALIRKVIMSLLDFADGLLSKTDWASIGLSIGKGIGGAEKDGIQEGLSGENGFFDGFIGKLFKVMSELSAALTILAVSIGAGIVRGILEGIEDKLDKISLWLENNVITPFMDGLKDKFGIKNGSSSKTKTVGTSLMTGMKNGVSEKLSTVTKLFSDLRTDIEDKFSDIGSWFSDRFGAARTNIETKFSGIGNWFAERRKDISDSISDIPDIFSEKFSSAYDKVKNAFSGADSWFKEKFQSAYNNVTGIFGGIGDWFGGRWNDIKDKFTYAGSWFRDRFQAAYDNVTRIWDNIPQFFWDTWMRIAEGATNGLNSVIDVIESFVNSVIDGFNILSNVKFRGQSIAEKADHIEIPRLASGGLAKAPTLAMVGDNRNASVDPEVISPLSKLQGMIDSGNGNAEIIELLKLIVELLRSGISAELIGSVFESDFKRTVLRIVADDNARRGTG